MDLYLLRHAIALDREDFHGSDDSQRPLTTDGRKKMRRAAKGMRKLGLCFDVILSSPYVRARDTADIVADTYTNRRHLKLTGLLEPGADQKALVRHLSTLGSTHSIMLVGHEPDLSTLLAKLIGARRSQAVKLKKGALCLLSIKKLEYGACAKLEWLLTANHLGSVVG
jgi:phosphohistidine phosphatase